MSMPFPQVKRWCCHSEPRSTGYVVVSTVVVAQRCHLSLFKYYVTISRGFDQPSGLADSLWEERLLPEAHSEGL
jgi:hypothetical protein